jgi:MFS family permease
LNRRTNPTQL